LADTATSYLDKGIEFVADVPGGCKGSPFDVLARELSDAKPAKFPGTSEAIADRRWGAAALLSVIREAATRAPRVNSSCVLGAFSVVATCGTEKP
jgi:hypothetical protein